MAWASQRRWHLALIAAAGLVAYASAIPNGFVYDDHILIEQDSRITGPVDLAWIFQTDYWGTGEGDGLYRPLTVLSFAVDHAIFGSRPAAFHGINILLHVGVGIALYFLTFRLFGDRSLGLVASILFVLHPVHTEAVTGIVGRSEILACLFLILSLEFALPPVSANRLGGCLVFFLLALLSKENAVVLLALYPAVLILRPGERKGAWLPLACMGAVVAFWFLLRLRATGTLILREGYSPLFLVNPLAHVDTMERWATAVAGLGMYIRLLFLPVSLSADYSYNQIPIQEGFVSLPVIGWGVGVAALAIWAVLARKKVPAISLGIAWFLCSILPTTNLFFPIGTIFGERLLYLPSVGFCLALGVLLGRARWKPTFLVVAVLFAAGTAVRNRDWRDDETLFASIIRDAPRSAKGYYELGVIRQAQRRDEEAIRLFWEATKIYPDYAEAHYNRGGSYRALGEVELAIEDYQEAVRADPEFAEAHHNLAICYASAEALEAAEESLREAIRLKPALEKAWMHLAIVLRELWRPEEALQVLDELLGRKPSNVPAHLLAAEICLVKLKDKGKALDHLKKALQIDPAHPAFEKIDPGLHQLLRENGGREQ